MESLNGSKRLGEYLRTLRKGYGFSLRTVEHKAKEEGFFLDNSQLSRYEKGACFPSFDKLKILADIFNVSIQSFSDIVELERFEKYKDRSKSYDALIDMGNAEFRSGNHGKAYALYESALESLERDGFSGNHDELTAKARCAKAISLAKLGKLGLAEHELRSVLKQRNTLQTSTQLLVLLELSNIHMELGETFIASLEASTCYEMALKEKNEKSAAFALHLLGSVASEHGESEKAISFYTEAKKIHENLGNAQEAINLSINIGSHLIATGKHKEGCRLIREALKSSEEKGYARSSAYALYKLARAYFLKKDYKKARIFAKRSDAKAESADEQYADIKFLNNFYLWKMAIEEQNEIEERLAFGRLKFFRKSLERRFSEIEEFDSFIERGKAQ